MGADHPPHVRDRLGHLPERHLAALRAVLAGFDDDDVAGLLGIPVEAVGPTVRLATAKLLAALAGGDAATGGAGGDGGASWSAPAAPPNQ